MKKTTYKKLTGPLAARVNYLFQGAISPFNDNNNFDKARELHTEWQGYLGAKDILEKISYDPEEAKSLSDKFYCLSFNLLHGEKEWTLLDDISRTQRRGMIYENLASILWAATEEIKNKGIDEAKNSLEGYESIIRSDMKEVYR